MCFLSTILIENQLKIEEKWQRKKGGGIGSKNKCCMQCKITLRIRYMFFFSSILIEYSIEN